jgi:hypothetical protein
MWTMFGITLLTSLLLAVLAGAMLRAVDADIPWPASPGEEGHYNAGRTLAWLSAGIAVLGSGASAICAPRAFLFERVLVATGSLFITGLISATAFFAILTR